MFLFKQQNKQIGSPFLLPSCLQFKWTPRPGVLFLAERESLYESLVNALGSSSHYSCNTAAQVCPGSKMQKKMGIWENKKCFRSEVIDWVGGWGCGAGENRWVPSSFQFMCWAGERDKAVRRQQFTPGVFCLDEPLFVRICIWKCGRNSWKQKR